MFIFFFVLGLFFIDCNSFIIEAYLPFSFLLEIPFSFNFDYISFFFFSFISLISSVVFIYRKFYMEEKEFFNSDNSRFFFILFLFVISIFFLVFSNSWVIVILGWDGLGVVSFLLVIYYNNIKSLNSGLVTVFTNRLGDCFFILSFTFIFYCGVLSFDFLTINRFLFFLLILIVGCFTKRAQLPFSSWLPAAIAAPTPISSLVHSSTLVTAGVYLIVRFNYLFYPIFNLIGYLSVFTIVIAGCCAIFELDFKKIVAMSTLRQLGFMIFCISIGFWFISFLHIIFHAFFKRCLFLSTGRLIHLLLGNQDSRDYGRLRFLNFSKLFFTFTCLSLCGFPFFLGFYSKDFIISLFINSYSIGIVLLFFLACILTISYSIRLIIIAFFRFPIILKDNSFSEDKYFFLPLFFLYFFCIFRGNFFIFYFFPPIIFSFLDFFAGILIIFLGIFIFYFSFIGYFSIVIFSSVLFFSFFFSSFFSKSFKYFPLNFDLSWREILGGMGTKNFLFLVKFFLVKFYLLGFYYLFFLLGLLWVILEF